MKKNKIMFCMLIDDDADDREFFLLALENIQRQIKCEMFGDPERALSALHKMEPRPSMIFVDMRMPRVSGPEVVTQIRSQSQFNSIPIVLYSTADEEYGNDEAKKCGASYFFTKPPNINELSEILREVIDKFTALTGR